MAPLSQVLQLGFRFNPSQLHAVAYYLPRLVAGEPLHESVARFVHSADVYACEPGTLAASFLPVPKTEDRFFFTTCRRQKAGKASRAVRVAGPGTWSSQRSIDVLDGAGVKVGEMTKLRYKKGTVLTDWLMDEFSCLSEGAIAGDRQHVLCKIYVSPRAPPDSAARNESAAFFAQPAPHEPAVLIAQAPPPCKRPAPAPFAKPPCAKRMRAAAVAPAPPVVEPAGHTTLFAPPRPCAVPRRGMPPPSTTSVTRTPASALPPAPVQTRPGMQPCRTPAPAPPRPYAPPQQQKAPLPTLSVARACHTPQQAAARHCPPRPSVLTPPVTPAPLTPRPPPAATCPPAPVAPPDLPFTEAPAADEDDLWDDLDKVFEETVPMLEAGEETAACSDEDDDSSGDFAKQLEDTLPTGEAAD